MSKFIEVNLEKCTACRLCEFACSTHHFGEINPAKSRIKVSIVSKDFFYYPNVCQQCGRAPCVDACPQEKALVRNQQTGAIEVNTEECIGCRMCVRACPFGAMQYYDDQETAVKSDLCVERLNNEQVLAYSSVCPTGFILWGETKPIPDRLVGKPCHRISS